MSSICDIECDAPALETRLRQSVENLGGCFAIIYNNIDGECDPECEGIHTIQSALSKVALSDSININEVEEGEELTCEGYSLNELFSGAISKEDDCYGLNVSFVEGECASDCDEIIPLREKIARAFTKISDFCYSILAVEIAGEPAEQSCDNHSTLTLSNSLFTKLTDGRYALLLKKKV